MVFFLSFIIKVEAQNINDEKSFTDDLETRSFLITTNLLGYAPINLLKTGEFNLGVETNLNKRSAASLNLGYVRSYTPTLASTNFLFPSFIGSIDTKGIKASVELKRFFTSKYNDFLFTGNKRTYWSFQGSYQHTRTRRPEHILDGFVYFINEDGDVILIHPTSTKINIYNTYRNVGTIGFKIGQQLTSENNFLVLDYGVGGGFQYVSSHSDSRQGKEVQYIDGQEYNFHLEDQWPNNQNDYFFLGLMHKHFDSGSAFFPNILFHVRIGWKYTKQK